MKNMTKDSVSNESVPENSSMAKDMEEIENVVFIYTGMRRRHAVHRHYQ